ncbi:hypothetical protein FACS1894116_10140 [Betaproteobacteria bacterium]|nr:hypothetical protein FACS1894116_10140 [Betaproteobacteria bacterium]
MTSNTISQYLNLVNLQIAAEAFLVEDDKDYKSVKTGDDLTYALTKGNKHSSKFTSADQGDCT